MRAVKPEQLAITPRCRKKPYPTHGQAMGAMSDLYRVNRERKKNRGKLNVYFCPACEAWHVGHKPKWAK